MSESSASVKPLAAFPSFSLNSSTCSGSVHSWISESYTRASRSSGLLRQRFEFTSRRGWTKSFLAKRESTLSIDAWVFPHKRILGLPLELDNNCKINSPIVSVFPEPGGPSSNEKSGLDRAFKMKFCCSFEPSAPLATRVFQLVTGPLLLSNLGHGLMYSCSNDVVRSMSGM